MLEPSEARRELKPRRLQGASRTSATKARASPARSSEYLPTRFGKKEPVSPCSDQWHRLWAVVVTIGQGRQVQSAGCAERSPRCGLASEAPALPGAGKRQTERKTLTDAKIFNRINVKRRWFRCHVGSNSGGNRPGTAGWQCFRSQVLKFLSVLEISPWFTGFDREVWPSVFKARRFLCSRCVAGTLTGRRECGRGICRCIVLTTWR